MESNLLKEAIADAKAVKQTALANAKMSLQEAFTEKYSAMFAEKLREDAALDSAAPQQESADAGTVSEQEIDALIKELESEVGGEEAVGEPDLDDQAAAVPPAPAAVPPMGGPVAPPAVPGAVPPGCPPCPTADAGLGGIPGVPAAPGALPPVGGPVPPVAPAPVGGEIPPAPEGVPSAPPSEIPDETDEEINLDELLESLKEEIEEESIEEAAIEEDEAIEENTKLTSSGIGGNKAGGSANKKPASGASSSSKIETGGLKQEGVPSPEGTKVGPEDATEASRPNQAKNATSTNLSTPSKGGESGQAMKAKRPNAGGSIDGTSKLHEENETLKKQLNEAHETIKYVKGQLNEINLLNAKLLYTNMLFKEFNMSNDNKMRIVEMFDLSRSVREVKLTYANIAESLSFSGSDIKRKSKTSANAQSITEGLASQSVASTKPSKEIISEGKTNQMVTRFQQIAGIKPTKK